MSDPSNRHPLFARVAIALLCAGLCSPGMAEKADKDKPINLEADKVSIDDAKKVSVFEGNVVLTQGTMVIRADRMVMNEDPQGFMHGTAYGHPTHFRQRREGTDEYVEGEAERIEYDGKTEVVQLFDRAQLKRGADQVRSNYISYNQRTEVFKALGSYADSSGTPATGRVRAIIQPKTKDQDKDKDKTVPPALHLKTAPALTDPRK